LPFVFNTAHSGRIYPARFVAGSRLDEHGLRRSEDCFVDQLFSESPALGAPLLMAHFPRAYLDANREPYELDPRMFDGRLPSYANTRSMRVAGGLGVIPRIVAEGQEIYRERLPVSEALSRIDQIYRPYHRALRGLLTKTHQRFGEVYLFDCHSMPSASIGPSASIEPSGSGAVQASQPDIGRPDIGRPDIVLGDRYGTSCTPRFIDAAQAAFEQLGFSVMRNRPYAGGFITEHYGDPVAGNHALQIEINRALYMDEERLLPHAGFESVKHAMTQAVQIISDIVGRKADSPRLAAE
jgi:N-formylglutamate amidohydrolase